MNKVNYEKGIATRARIYAFLKKYIGENGCSPSVREIMRGSGLKTTEAVVRHLRKMKADGVIDYKEYEARTITLKEGVE